MATNYDDINKTEQVKNILTEAQLAEMVAKGTVPPNEEFFTFDDDEDENLDCLRTEVVYDMNSNEPSLNWGYKTGIKGGNTAIGGKDFSKYQFLIITARQGNASMTSIMDLTILNTVSNTYNSGALGCEAADTDYCKFTVNAEKTEFTCNRIGYRTTSGSIVDMYHENAVCMKIVGIIKSPAMIYTGKELHEGKGVSIKDGVISSLLKGAMCRQTNTDQHISGTTRNIKYERLVSSIGSGVSYSNGNFTIGDGISCIKFTIDCNFYNMTGVSYFRVLPKKNGTLTGDELWYFFDSGHSGGFSQTIMLSCKSGDVFTLDCAAVGYEGYLNGNSYITVEVF